MQMVISPRGPGFHCFALGCFLLMLQPVTGLCQNQPVAPKEADPVQPTVTVSKKADRAEVSPGEVPSPSYSGQSGSSFGAANGDYILQAGDTIEMVVYREPDLSIRSRIGRDHMVQLPLLGEVRLGGLSVRNATAFVRQKYNADYLVEPQIYLNVASYNPRKFTIIGQVGKPGAYEFSGGESLGLLEAIGMAGGFTRIADRGHIIVKRREGDSVRAIKVNAKKLSDVGVDRFEIQAGDVINVGESWY